MWKEIDLKDAAAPEALREFRQDWVKPGSETGKRLDDADSRRLAWADSPKAGKVLDVYKIHFAGMDRILREVILASQMTRQICLFTAIE